MTEPGYLTKWARLNRRNVRLEISDSGMTPDALVHRAKEHVKRNRRTKRSEPEFDEIWCIFDIDQHPNISRAIHDARQSGINVALSNPCFELWLVLHRDEQTAYIDGHAIQQRSDELGITAKKRILPSAEAILVEAVDTAKQRAIALDRRHAGNGSPPRSNPSTDAWRLVDQLRTGLQRPPGGPPQQPSRGGHSAPKRRPTAPLAAQPACTGSLPPPTDSY